MAKRERFITLGGCGAFISGLTALIGVLFSTGVLGGSDEQQPEPPPFTPRPVMTDTARPTQIPPTVETLNLDPLVSDLLGRAVQAEILAYRNLDASHAASVYRGQLFDLIEEGIGQLISNDMYREATFDFDNSHYVDIRQVNTNLIEVDTCEYWETSYYSLTDNSFIQLDPMHLVPQTLTLELFSDGWFITGAVFYDPPAFC